MRGPQLFILTLLLILLVACTGFPEPQPASHTLKILAAETFLGDIAQNVAGTRSRVDVLIPVGVEPHEFEARPQDIVRIATSQVLIVNGLGYEPWLKKTLENVDTSQQIIVASQGLTPFTDSSGENQADDPHMWMAPLNVVHYVENIRDGLTRADPAGKEVYANNAQIYIAKLKELNAWVKAEVDQLPLQKRLLVTNHDALGYFARAYGFKMVGAVIPSVTDQASPSAGEMAGLIETIRSTAAPAIFLDIGENQKLAQQLAAETNTTIVTDLYVEGTSAADGPAPAYIDMIKHDVSEIISALR